MVTTVGADPVAQLGARVAEIRGDRLAISSHPTVPMGPVSTDG